MGTPLQIAITRGFTDIAGVLLSSGANPNVGEKRTPLFIAVNKGNIDAVRLLLAAGADPDAAASLDLETPIHEAAHLGNQSMVRMLIEAGADPNVLTARRQHALHLALFYGRTELAEYLKPLTTLEFDPEPVTDHIDDVDMKAAEEYVRWHCGYCHQLGQLTDGDKAGPGPRLWSMEGLPKGSDPDFEYSPGMFSSKVDWSEDELNRWLAGAPLVVPGTLMDVSPYAPMTDPETRAAVIAFLRTLGTPTDR